MDWFLYDRDLRHEELITSVDTMYHDLKSDMMKSLSGSTNKRIARVGGKSTIIIEMSPLIQEKCWGKADITSFSELAVILYYEVLQLVTDHERFDIVLGN